MSDAVLRILLACYLAIWSPAMCCCGVKAAIGAVTRIDVGDCHGIVTPSSSSTRASEVSAAGGCCAHVKSGSQVERIVAEACSPPEPANSPAPCRCHESLESKVRLDTGAKIVVPALTPASILPSFSFAMAGTVAALNIDVMETSIESWVKSMGALGPPQFVTLHAQRTLLLI